MPPPLADDDVDVAASLAVVRHEIETTALAAGRAAGSVALIAVSKLQPDHRIQAALGAGQRRFGENRVQEAMQRWAGRRAAMPDLSLHLIGPLQTNKARDAVALFDVIEVVDRPKLAAALAAACHALGRTPRFLVQVNTGEEPQKAGVSPDGLPDLLAYCRDEARLAVDGLMCLPPADEAPALHFALLADLAARHGLSVLSMGMSGDYPTAIRHGATQVRVGTGVFGARPTRAGASSTAPVPGGASSDTPPPDGAAVR